jgi:Mrp family chromosome partitioning ATPase
VVERLKIAIEKAEQRRRQALTQPGAAPEPPKPGGPLDWSTLREFVPTPAQISRERLVAYGKTDPSHIAFDVLRTRLLKLCAENGWTRIGFTSPTKGCGKSLVAANVAFSLSRNAEGRVLLADMDLKAPRLAPMLGLEGAASIKGLLSGQAAPSDFLMRVGSNLAIAFNTERVRDSSELMQASATRTILDGVIGALKPDLTIFDLPPMLVSDDVISFLPNLDAVLLVAAAGQTRAQDIEECERLLSEGAVFLGVVLNKYEAPVRDSYLYEYAHA